jgi:hypothetical protein
MKRSALAAGIVLSVLLYAFIISSCGSSFGKHPWRHNLQADMSGPPGLGLAGPGPALPGTQGYGAGSVPGVYVPTTPVPGTGAYNSSRAAGTGVYGGYGAGPYPGTGGFGTGYGTGPYSMGGYGTGGIPGTGPYGTGRVPGTDLRTGPYGTRTYGEGAYGSRPYGTGPFDAGGYGTGPYGAGGYGTDLSGQGPYGPERYGLSGPPGMDDTGGMSGTGGYGTGVDGGDISPGTGFSGNNEYTPGTAGPAAPLRDSPRQ